MAEMACLPGLSLGDDAIAGNKRVHESCFACHVNGKKVGKHW